MVCISDELVSPWGLQKPPANARDAGGSGSTPGLERPLGAGHGNPLQSSSLGNATVHGVTELDMTEHTRP